MHVGELGHDGEVMISFGGALPEFPAGGQDVLRYSSFDSDPSGYVGY